MIFTEKARAIGSIPAFVAVWLAGSMLCQGQGQEKPPESGPANDIAAQDRPAKDPVTAKEDSPAIRLSTAYGHLMGNKALLEAIARQHPSLAEEAKAVGAAFDRSAFGGGTEALEGKLTGILGEKWPPMLERVRTKAEAFQAQPMDRDKAKQLLRGIQATAAQGKLPENLRRTLLAYHPAYMAQPEMELQSGWNETFRSREDAKAKGPDFPLPDFSLTVPMSWRSRTPTQPETVRIYQSCDGAGEVGCVVKVKKRILKDGKLPTEEETQEGFSAAGLEKGTKHLPGLVECMPQILGGCPGAMIVNDRTADEAGHIIPVRDVHFAAAHGGNLILIDFTVHKFPETTGTIDELYRKNLPALKLIANSLVIHKKGKE